MMPPNGVPGFVVKQRVLRTDAARMAAHLPGVLASEDPQQEAGRVFTLLRKPLR
jgi:hypothetical protein